MTVILSRNSRLSRTDLDRLRRSWPKGRRNPSSASFDSYSVTGPDDRLRFAVLRLPGGAYLRLDGHLQLLAFGSSLEAVLPPEAAASSAQ